MGYEIRLHYHPKKQEGVGYDTEQKEVAKKKVGKPFDDTSLEKLAATLMAQMARRDILIFDVEIDELVKRPVSFKESKDGKGIILKGKRFSFDQTAQVVEQDIVQTDEEQVYLAAPESPVQHPHELIVQQRQSGNLENLYMDANRNIPVKKQEVKLPPVNQKKVLYYVYFDPDPYRPEAQRLGLKFTEDRKYPVHQIVPHPSGRLDAQSIILTDDTGRPVKTEEKFFTSAGSGLVADELGFSESTRRTERRTKLAFEDQMVSDFSGDIPVDLQGIPLDDGTISKDLMEMPDLRVRKAQ